MSRALSVAAVVILILGTPLRIPEAYGQGIATVDSVLTFGPSEVQSSVVMFYEYFGPPDSISILVLGAVSKVRPPIEWPDTNEPPVELTYILGGLSDPEIWFWDSVDGEYGGMWYEFQSGYFRLYSDSSPDLDFSNPATFQDGELLLEGTLPEYRFYSGSGYPCPQCYPEHAGFVDFTGGDLFPQVSRNGVGFRGRIDQTSFGDAPLDSLITPGRGFPSHGWMELYVPTAVRETTWGRIKRLYAS